MIIFLSIIIFILVCVIIALTLNIKEKNSNLRYINKVLLRIINTDSTERIRGITINEDAKELSKTINDFINKYNLIKTKEIEMELSMKKMLSNMSHDLRTPLTVILGYIDQIISNRNITEEQKQDYLMKLKSKIEAVILLINDFFSLSKLESGDNSIELSKINVSEVLRELVLGFYETIESAKIDINIEIPDEDIYCVGNIDALKRILNNLISNALKYGMDGKYLGIKLSKDNANNYGLRNKIWFEVTDKGKGIPEKEASNVFERLYTLEDSRNKNYQGSGLGLAISKILVNKMNGEIFLESIPYKRTIFKFFILED